MFVRIRAAGRIVASGDWHPPVHGSMPYRRSYRRYRPTYRVSRRPYRRAGGFPRRFGGYRRTRFYRQGRS